jgi:O-antigen/teichoic acid export membrane protein
LAQNKNYWDASYVIPLIALTIFFTMLRDISLTGLHITKKTKIVAIAISSMAVINILLNIILIPVWNFIGAALATLVAQILFFIGIYIIAQRKYHIPYELIKIIKIMGVAIAIFFVGQLTNDYELWMRLLFKHLLLFLFPVLLYFWNFYDQVELERIASLKSIVMNKIKNRK